MKKYVFNENKINIFTIVPYSKRNDPVIKACIDSWKKIPNADIHLFDASVDIKDIFPEIVENDKYYQLMNNNNEGEVVKSQSYEARYDPETGEIKYDQWYIPHTNKEGPYTGDQLRLKMLREIPNAVYIDSDIYIFDVDKFLETYNSYDFAQFEYHSTSFMLNKKKHNCNYINKLLDFYEKEITEVCVDYSVVETFFAKYLSNKDNPIIDEGPLCYNTFYTHNHQVKWQIHLFSEKYSMINTKNNALNIHLAYYNAAKYGYAVNGNEYLKKKIKEILFSHNDERSLVVLDDSILWSCHDDPEIKNNPNNVYSNSIFIKNLETIYDVYARDAKDTTDFKNIIRDIIIKIYGLNEQMINKSNFIIHKIE